MQGIIKQLLITAMAASLLFAAAINPLSTANAQAISQAQIEQFKKLPRSQQEMLARQYGFDLSMLEGGASNKASDTAGQEYPEIMEARDKNNQQREQTTPDDLEKQFDVSDKSLQPFGYKLFAGKPTTFAPVSHAPVPSNYTVGSGDTVSIQLYGKESQDYEFTVDRQGRITIPELGPIQVAGLSFSDVQALIKNEVANRMIGMQAAVSMGKLRSIQIYVMGEAYQPGTYTVSSLTTMMQALIVSGGVSDIASLRNIQLKRDGNTLTTLDLYDFLIKGDPSGDRLLQQGDIVFIPPRGDMVRVYGEVLRPAIYELRNERSLKEVIQLAGGTKAGAYTDSIRIKRIDGSKRITQTVDLDAANAIQLRNGDEVEISAVSDEMNQSIMLVGAVARPGYYEWREGIRINNIIKNVSSGLLGIADLGYGIVVRERNLRRDIDIYQFDVAAAVSGQTQDNIELLPRDQVVIFSRYENASDEKLLLSDWILNESEKERKERQELLREYRKKYYRELAGVEEKDEEEGTFGESEVASKLQGLFSSSDTDEGDEIEEYALYSRNNLLEPILAKLRNQFSYDRELPIVSVTGEVRYPGIYPLARNASEMDLISAAGGFKESAYLDRAEVTRSSIVDGQTQTDYVTVNLRESLAGREQVQLKGRDSLHVFQIPEWQNTVEVTLKGEVRFPGTYTVRRGETLSALVERAGGFTDYAFPQGAIFTREELKTLEKERMRVLAQQLQQEIATNAITGSENNTRSYNETRQLLTDLMNVEPVGRLIIDLPQIISGDVSDDIELKDGDRLVIPNRRNTVNIIGEVQMASSYVYDGSLNAHDYIRRAGGIRKKADEERIFIVKSNGSIEMLGNGGWFGLGNDKRLEPGDTIVVPLDTQYKDGLTVWSQATQIVYQIGVALAALAAI
ncbi:SLBB domain-containing protein [Pseudidiomarina sp.]|uniref:SLBB domain-containing protein n=1 Tax=Pseudidiomarina sp. TaxID=2081707 RepID=UPI003A981516